jgi:ankyrin repeat protein
MSQAKRNGIFDFSLNWLTVGLPLAVLAFLVILRTLPTNATRIVVASQTGHAEIVERLLDRGINPNLTNGTNSLLIVAVRSKQMEVAKVLLARGADPNLTAGTGITPLSWAIRTGDPALVEILVQSGADPQLRSINGKTAFDEAQSVTSILEVLRRATNGSLKRPTRP